MKKTLLLVGLIAYTNIAFSQYCSNEQLAYTQTANLSWQQIVKDTKENTISFFRQILQCTNEKLLIENYSELEINSSKIQCYKQHNKEIHQWGKQILLVSQNIGESSSGIN